MNRYRWLAGAVMLALVLPRIAQRGMFLDGITYAVIARNMAVGDGSLWRPHFSRTVYPVFFEQPPLGMAMQSLAFRLLGDHLAVERLWSIAVFALTALLMMAIWRRFLPSRYDSLPIFFWMVPSVVTWAVINNILETTQGLFTILSVWCVMRAADAGGGVRVAGWAIAAAAGIVVACLTKGPVGLFPLATPILLLLGPHDRRPSTVRAAAIAAGMTAAVALTACALLLFEGPRASLAGFIDTHLVPALQGERGMPRRSSDIARHLTLGIWARMAALALVLWLVRRRGAPVAGVPRVAWVFFAIGVSASLPLLGSPVLAGHYFVPSIPFFALAAAAWSLPWVQTFQRPEPPARPSVLPLALAGGLVVTAVAVLVLRGPIEKRDVRLLEGFDAMSATIPRVETIGTCIAAGADWGLHSYTQRLFRVSLDASDAPRAGFFLVRDTACAAPAGCVAAEGNEAVQLYRCPR